MKKARKAYTIVEALVTLAILSVLIITVSTIFINALRSMNTAKQRTVAVSLGSEILERLRNMAYDNIGTQGGVPNGPIPQVQSVTRSGTNYSIATRIDYIDDPFDGLVVGTNPLDTVPADYKRAEVAITWLGTNVNVVLTSRYAPNGLELATNTGALIISVFDSSGKPVPSATVRVTNPTVTPAVDVTQTTDVNGNWQLLSMPPSVQSYHIDVTKTGYSHDSTIAISGGNPNPVKSDATVAIQQATSISFAIDTVATLNATTFNQNCSVLPNFSFNLFGQKLIGQTPDVLKFDQSQTTDANGKKTISNLEWDDYDIHLNTSGYDIAGYSPPNALHVLPGAVINWTLILAPHTSNSLLLNVIDANTKLPVTDASVTVTGPNGSQKTTGRGFLNQTDWSGGNGQITYGDLSKYQDDDTNVDTTSTPGQVKLKVTTSQKLATVDFSSSSSQDAVTTTADWNTAEGNLKLQQSAGVYSVTGAGQTIQLNTEQEMISAATLSVTDQQNGQTIEYYLAADGVSFEQVTPGSAHTFASQGSDLRLKILLSTSDTAITPTVSLGSITYTASQYSQSGVLESSTFDTGSPSTYSTLSWNPKSQIASVGSESIKLQIASNNDNSTWDYVGPDGTNATYYTISDTQTASVHADSQYVRYKLFLHTDDTSASPVLSDVSIGYTSQCTPPGQVFYSSLNSQTYTVTVTNPLYQEYTAGVDVNGSTSATVTLIPF